MSRSKTKTKHRPTSTAGRPAGRQAATVSRPSADRRRTPAKVKLRPAVRHGAVAVLAGALVWVFWMSRPRWSADMRLWKAVGDSAFVLLLLTLALGPLVRLARPLTSLLPWRRQLGIWFAIVASIHGLLILNGWARWSLRRFLGYEFVPQLGREARMEPGFGLANLIGVVALGLALVLAATSSDWALRKLGASAWRWLHHSALFVFYLSLLHAGYFLFLHYTASFHKNVPPADWFRFPFVLLGATLVTLQIAAFTRTASRRRGTATATA